MGKSWQEQYSRVPSEAKKPYMADLMVLADKRIANLDQEINILKGEKVQQSETIATLTNKVYWDIYYAYTYTYIMLFCVCSAVMI